MGKSKIIKQVKRPYRSNWDTNSGKDCLTLYDGGTTGYSSPATRLVKSIARKRPVLSTWKPSWADDAKVFEGVRKDIKKSDDIRANSNVGTQHGEYVNVATDGHRLLARKGESDRVAPSDLVSIPKDYVTIRIGAGTLELVIRRALVMADERSHMVILRFDAGNVVRVESKTDDVGEFSESLTFDGSNYADRLVGCAVGLNGDYILPALRGCGEVQIALHRTEPGLNSVNLSYPFADWRYVVMPTRI